MALQPFAGLMRIPLLKILMTVQGKRTGEREAAVVIKVTLISLVSRWPRLLVCIPLHTKLPLVTSSLHWLPRDALLADAVASRLFRCYNVFPV